jgi:prophage tail gpP-like protein
MSLFSQGRRVTLTIDGVTYDSWTTVRITRDLEEACASFEVTIDDRARVEGALPGSASALRAAARVRPFSPCSIAIDGELVLRGHIDDVSPEMTETGAAVSISGRDVAADLVDCACAPKGPVEHRDIKLDELVSKICKPFAMTCQAEVDIGQALKKLSIDTGETVWSVVEKAARMRGVLAHSDGTGQVLLTRSGTRRGPGPILFPSPAVKSSRGQFSGRERHSDWYVKGQAGEAGWKRAANAPLDVRGAPGLPGPGDSDGDQPSGRESRAVALQGHAQDGAVGRWRPKVMTTRGQGTLDDAKTQAKWWANTSRGRGDCITYVLHDFRHASGALWRPNEMVMVIDPFQGIEKELLVAGVTYAMDEQGASTELRLTGKTAFDIQAEGEDGAGAGEGEDFSGDVDTGSLR